MTGWLTLRFFLVILAGALTALFYGSHRQCDLAGGNDTWLNGCRADNGTRIEINVFEWPEP